MTVDDALPAGSEARLRAALDAAATTAPVPDAWDAIHARVAGDDAVVPIGAHRRPLPALAIAAAVVVLVGLAGLVVAVGRDDGGEVRAGPTGDLCAVLAGPARTTTATMVFLNPQADMAGIDEVRALIDAAPGVRTVRFVDQEEAFAHAQELFADDPTMSDLLQPEDVPPSFGVEVEDRAAAEALRTALIDHPAVYEVELDRVDPTPDVAGALAAISEDDMHPLAAGAWPADPDVVAALRAAAPPERADEVGLAADALTAPLDATEEARDAAGAVAASCASAETEATGWYVPVDLPEGWTVDEVVASRSPDDTCSDGTPSGTRESVLWVDVEARARIAVQSTGCPPVDEGSDPVEDDTESTITWSADGTQWILEGAGLTSDELVAVAGEVVAEGAPGAAPSGFTEHSRWTASGPAIEVGLLLTGPSGTRYAARFHRPGHGVGRTLVDPRPHEVPGQDLPVDRVWQPASWWYAVRLFGAWPGADLDVMVLVEGSPAAGSAEERAQDAEVDELVGHLRPATTAEWRAFLDDVTHTAVLDVPDTFADLAALDLPSPGVTTTSTAPG